MIPRTTSQKEEEKKRIVDESVPENLTLPKQENLAKEIEANENVDEIREPGIPQPENAEKEESVQKPTEEAGLGPEMRKIEDKPVVPDENPDIPKATLVENEDLASKKEIKVEKESELEPRSQNEEQEAQPKPEKIKGWMKCSLF